MKERREAGEPRKKERKSGKVEKNQETKKKHENYKTETEDPSIRHQQTMKAKEPKISKGEKEEKKKNRYR